MRDSHLQYDFGGILGCRAEDRKVSVPADSVAATPTASRPGTQLTRSRPAICRMDTVGDALEEVLSKARSQRTITVGVYEAAKLLNVDPDNVVLCLLAADEDDDRDVALQIHFTLIRAFCCENDINILRVSNPGRLAELLLLENDKSPAESGGAAQTPDLHCVLVTVRDPGLQLRICWGGPCPSWTLISRGF